MIELHTDVVLDEVGQPKAILLPLADWNEVLKELEELDDLRAYDTAKANQEEFIPLAQALQELAK